MRIEFLTEEDFYVLPFFEEFVKKFSPHFDIVRVSCCPILGSRSRRKLALDLLALYGPLGVGRLVSRQLGSKLFSRLRRGQGARRYFSIAQLCAAYRIPCDATGNPNEEPFRLGLSERGADVLISIACPYILKSKVLSTPRLGCLNLHNAPLPRYKGMMPTFWQLFHGEKSVGLTVHTMTEAIDEGKILYQDQVEITEGETLDELILRSKRRAAHCVAKVLHELEHGDAHPRPMAREKGSYFTFPSRAEIAEFRRRGLRAI